MTLFLLDCWSHQHKTHKKNLYYYFAKEYCVMDQLSHTFIHVAFHQSSYRVICSTTAWPNKIVAWISCHTHLHPRRFPSVFVPRHLLYYYASSCFCIMDQLSYTFTHVACHQSLERDICSTTSWSHAFVSWISCHTPSSTSLSISLRSATFALLLLGHSVSIGQGCLSVPATCTHQGHEPRRLLWW